MSASIGPMETSVVLYMEHWAAFQACDTHFTQREVGYLINLIASGQYLI